MKRWYCASVVAVMVGVVGFAFATSSPAAPEKVAEAEEHGHHHGLKPVETNMHEFMEYAFEGPYKRLRVSMAKEPANGKAWFGVKSDALILAEGGNLLLMRGPKEHREDWTKYALSVREIGGKMYMASRKRNYAEARKNYTAMLVSCNACHKKFAGGKHQLKP